MGSMAIWRAVVGVVFAFIVPFWGVAARAEAPAVDIPPGFTDVAIAKVYGDPTDLAWLGNDLLVASQEGWLFRVEGGAPDAYPEMILDLSARIGKGPEQGLLGVVPDPEFATHPYVYVYYTQARHSGHCDVFPANCRNRVSRFTMGADGLLDPTSEQPLIDNLLVGYMHNAGDLAFDADGLLYVSTGNAGFWPNSQDLTNLNGKILRVDRDGNPAPGNPFAGPDSRSCREAPLPGSTAPCAEIYAYGLRNPFRIAFDPNSAEHRFYINDVGQDVWEEIDVGARGANYGWPEREGPCLTAMMGGKSDGCWTPTNYVAPIFAYPHAIGCVAITGGAFVPNQSPWGAAYQGRYLFADWVCGRIFVLNEDEDGRFSASTFASGLAAIVPLLFSPDGSALYYGREGGGVHAITRGDG
jgi:glucose/arabinose dehydrogenase